MLKITIEEPTKSESAAKQSLKGWLLKKMQRWINKLLEAERDEFLGRGQQVRLDPERDNYRNGYRSRRLTPRLPAGLL